MATILGTPGNDTYNGTSGVADTAVIDSNQSQSSFAFNGTNWVVTSAAGTDTLANIESVQFNDGLVGMVAGGGETRVNSTTANWQYNSAITSLSDGGYVVTWQSSGQDGSLYGIYAQRYDNAGVKAGDESLVNSTTTNNQQSPAITSLSDGGYVVTWQSYDLDGSVTVSTRSATTMPA
jgi:hypothetical protein